MSAETPERLTPQQIWEQAQHRYQDDAEFHARVVATAQLLGWQHGHTVVSVVHATDLVNEMVKLHKDLAKGLEGEIATTADRKDPWPVHLMGPACVKLSLAKPFCSGCGGHYELAQEQRTYDD